MTTRNGRRRRKPTPQRGSGIVHLVAGIAMILAASCSTRDQGIRGQDPPTPVTAPRTVATPAAHVEPDFYQLERLWFPPPQWQGERWAQTARGKWRAWIEARDADPGSHFVSWDVRLYRAVAGDVSSVEQLAAGIVGGFGRDVALRADGAVLDGLGGDLVLIPATGPRLTIEGSQAVEILALYEDGFVAIELPRDGYQRLPGRMVMTFFDGPPSRTLAVLGDINDRVEVSRPVRDGSRLAWTQTVRHCSPHDEDCEEGTRVFAVDLSKKKAPHELAWTPRGRYRHKIFLDRLAGPWIVAHAGSMVHLLHWSGERELRLECPGWRVIAVQAGGVWLQARFDKSHLVWWDPLSGRRIHTQVPFKDESFEVDYWRMRMTYMTRDEDRIMLPFRSNSEKQRHLNGLWALSATPGKMIRLDAGALQRANDRLSEIRDSWNDDRFHFIGLGKSWPLPEEAVDLLVEIMHAADEPNHAQRAAYELGWSGLPGSREALLEMVEVAGFGLRRTVFTALGWCVRPGDSKRILGMDFPEFQVNYLTRTLAILGDPEAVPWLEARRDRVFTRSEQTDERCLSVPDALALLRERPEFNAAWDSIWP